MKKVLFVSSLYYPHVGGIETMITELSQFYKKLGIETVSLTKKWPANFSEEDEFNGIKIFRVRNARTDEEFFSVIDWLRSNASKIKADIIHVIGIRRPLPLIALLLSKWWGVPIMCTVAGGDVPDQIDSAPGRIWDEGISFIPDVLKQSDCVNCVSTALIKDLNRVIPDLNKVETLYAGMDFSVINNAKVEKIKKNYIFCLRRLDPSKGVDILIKAFNLIKDRFPDLFLVIAGDGSEKESLITLVESCSLSNRVIFIGMVELSRGMSLLKGATLTVVPSLSEGGGLVNVEAQATGCPVIASRVGGIPEYVKDGESGILFEPGNYQELAEKISQLLSDSSLQKKLIYGGIQYAQKFNWDILAPQYIELYEQLIRNHDKSSVFKPWSVLTIKLWDKLTN
jgi:glycosyltransferase involved in cell wall biosynthesis